MKLREVALRRIAVIKFRVDGDSGGCVGIEISVDTTKSMNIVLARSRQRRDLI